MHMRKARFLALFTLLSLAPTAIAGSAIAGSTTAASKPKTPTHHVYVYWDFNEQQNVMDPSGRQSELIPAWDPNGQMCLFPDGSGRFTTGYNPTLPSQHNPGSKKPLKNPPVGEAVWDKHGKFTGQTLYTPGPYALPGSKKGGDIPPDDTGGTYNNNGTFTGCAFDKQRNLFAADLGRAQGSFPPPDNGRIIEWFAPKYTDYCVVIGPTSGGDGVHHVDGTGGLQNPGTLASGPDGSLYIPEAGAGRVLRVRPSALPKNGKACGPNHLLDPPIVPEVFIGKPNSPGFPLGIARDPVCKCWAVSSVIGTPAVSWFDDNGQPVAGRGPIPGGKYSPFGLAVAPDGTVYFVDIAITCDGSGGCGPASKAGHLFRVTMNGGTPGTPEILASGLDFPTSVTLCDTAVQKVCPLPAKSG